MSKRLSKIARDLHVGMSTIVDFLNSIGYECVEDPTKEIQEDVVDLLKDNIKNLSLENKIVESSKEKENEDVQDKDDSAEVPLKLKIIAEASKHTKLIERIIDFTDFDWPYTVVRYKG